DSSPVVAGGRVYVGSSDGNLYVLDEATGRKHAEFDTGDAITASATVAAGRVVVGSTDGRLSCVGWVLLDLEIKDQTDIGSYFVATYPPFSVWSSDAVERHALPALASPTDSSVPLGMYLHIPFCRKRCHFCYFRVYTDKNAQDVVHYLDVLAREWE